MCSNINRLGMHLNTLIAFLLSCLVTSKNFIAKPKYRCHSYFPRKYDAGGPSADPTRLKIIKELDIGHSKELGNLSHLARMTQNFKAVITFYSEEKVLEKF